MYEKQYNRWDIDNDSIFIDFFVDEKYTLNEKKEQWILCSKENIIWIVGKRIDDRYKIASNTKKTYIAQLLKNK